jgi:hypothetical protein
MFMDFDPSEALIQMARKASPSNIDCDHSQRCEDGMGDAAGLAKSDWALVPAAIYRAIQI